DETKMKTIPHSPLEPRSLSRKLSALIVFAYAFISLVPIAWIFMTGFRTPEQAIAYPPRIVAKATVIGYVNLFTTRSRVSAEQLAAEPPPATWYEKMVRDQKMILAGPSRFKDRYINSLVVGFGSTLV